MNCSFSKRSKELAVVAVVCFAFILQSATTRAETLNKLFTGTVTLDGDISDFFQADGLTAKTGVCVANDPNGLDEPPLAANASQDKIAHPSGFNVRRLMTAYRHDLNNGTIFIGIDLPGGSGADSNSKTVHATAGNANPNYNDGVVGANFGGGGTGRGKIVPFDADANGEADTIGRKANASNLFRCPPAAGDIVDILDCADAAATGATDNPRTASGETVGARENYAVTVVFGNGAEISVEIFEAATTPAGQAQVQLSSTGTVGTPGAVVSTSTGGAGAILGQDIEIAITNINAAVTDPCARLNQQFVVDAGSNRDGSGQGEDQVVAVCNYDLPSVITCAVLFLTNDVPVTANLCGNGAPVGVDVGTTVQVAVTVTAAAGNGQDIVNCSIVVPGVGMVSAPGPLAPGQSSTVLVGSFACDPPGVRTVSATVTCEGAITEDGDCPPIAASCNAAIECCGEPCIKVIKEIACLLDPPSTCGPFGKSATGVKGDTQDPAFCYSITVTNCGNLALSNVTVMDNVLGDLSADYPDNLTPGQTETRHFTMTHSQNTKNTVTAKGDSAAGQVESMDSADAFVKQATISCIKDASSADDLDGNPSNNHVTLPDDGNSHLVTYTVMVTAGPGAALKNVTVTDNSLAGCNAGPFSLAAGSTTSITCSVELNCIDIPQAGLTNTVVVTGQVDTSNGDCGLDENGQPITVSSQCKAVVECEVIAVGGCRVTGGGITTNTFPAVRIATHGGQVGAPYSVPTPFTPDSDCITGEWQHVRHIRAGLRGNFHARSFDSLMCACLGCPENPDSPGKVGELCNPGDRICGPEPRRAPANKICFSGVGDYQETKGKREIRSVVFRVDVEDRSEPGGAHKRLPPDRYRMRIWFIDGDAGSDANLALRRAVACANPLTEAVDSSAPPPNIDDGGDIRQLKRGNYQIHPETGARCR